MRPAASSARARRTATALALPWHRLGLCAILLLATLLNFWRLSSVGYANSYYAAAVKSMLESWHNFFFVSFDPGGFVSIDKPPLGFWIQAASAKLFGYSGTSLLLPEALAGVLSVAVLYHLVGRAWGRGAGLLAALALAITPVAVVTSRNNTIDSLLVLAVLLAAWAVTRAAQTGSLRLLLLGAVLVGLGFNIKMLEAYLVVPGLGLLYLLGARAGLRTRIAHLLAAGVTLLAVSLSWAVAVDLTPASIRPYVGSSGNDSALNLALGYNGLQRLLGGNGTPGGGGSTSTGLFGGGPASPFRLLGTTLGGQVGWLLVLAVLGLVAATLSVPWRRMDERERSVLLWGGWLAATGGFFSVASFFHPYYTVMLAPAIAALVGIGVTALWRAYRSGARLGWLLPAALVASAAAEAYILRDYPDYSRWLTPLVAGCCLVGALALLTLRLRPRRTAVAAMAAGLAVGSLLAAPATWATYSITHTANATIPTAGPSAQNGVGANGGPGGFGHGPTGGNGGGQPGGAPPSMSPPGAAPSGSGTMQNAGPAGMANPGSSIGGATTRSGSTSTTAGAGNTAIGGQSGAPSGAARVGGGPGGDEVNAALVRYLEAHQGSTRYLVATASSMNASSIIISTGKPVMALGGFSGNDAILTTAQLAALIKSNVVHYFLVGGGGMGGNSALTQWVTSHGTAVPASQYEGSSTAAGGGQATLYYVSSAATGK